jgi:vitamin-K-epoxide reductase (warfarin-sensitive)
MGTAGRADLMRTALLVLAAAGILVSSLSLARHYAPEDESPDPHSYWNSSAVSHSDYSVVDGIPVAALGIAGYALLGVLAFYRRRELTAIGSLFGLAYALYLTNIEAHVLSLWCLYCVISLILITTTVFVAFAELLAHREPVHH